MKNKFKKYEWYEIWKNDRLFASFLKGEPSRFNKPFSRKIAILEFTSNVEFWSEKGIKANWELKIFEKYIINKE